MTYEEYLVDLDALLELGTVEVLPVGPDPKPEGIVEWLERTHGWSKRTHAVAGNNMVKCIQEGFLTGEVI